jgi:hypothetical protein
VRPRLRDYQDWGQSWKARYGPWLVGGASLSALTLYFASLIGGINLLEIFSGAPPPGAGRALGLSAGATALIGTLVVVTCRWLYAHYQRKRLPMTGERRRRAQACVRNLQDAVRYLSAKARLHAVVGDPSGLDSTSPLLFSERLWTLHNMLTRRQPDAPVEIGVPPEAPRLSSR